MNYDEIVDKLNDIKIEDHIWLIYIIIIFASWYANDLERKYFIDKDNNCKNKYRQVMISIFSILLIIYIYFFTNSLKGIYSIKPYDNIKKRKLTELSAMGSLFIVISGLIFLYVAINDNNIDIEIAFN